MDNFNFNEQNVFFFFVFFFCFLFFFFFLPMGMVGEACLSSNAYYPRTPDTPFVLGSMSVGLNILIRLWIYEFGLRLWYHDHNYLHSCHVISCPFFFFFFLAFC